ncbi:MAG: NAD(P)/FAD-dependent oxidoreductase [Bacteroides sp.]|nr:NAD(P)/FAD-dependent oxidoreductase [Bacteroides sp.]MCM1555852.1 NAD(P)/FAD-dependent oxidoreductase [Bacteroides sp.]
MEKFDVAIVGSGLGGLACGVMLAKEGMKVCVLERHSGVGGCLQSFYRKGRILDTGMHYAGSLQPGQILHQYFKYFGVIDRLRLQRLDPDAYDVIVLDNKEYCYANGKDRFAARLAGYFPNEKAGIDKYCRLLQTVGDLISPDVLRSGRISRGGLDFMNVSAYDVIAGCTQNETLRNVLAGTASLHSGDRLRTSFYEHGMIMYSYMESAYRFKGGSQHVADALADEIKKHGGEVRTESEVTALEVKDSAVRKIMIGEQDAITAEHVISDIHPANMLDMLMGEKVLRPTYRRHVRELPNSYGCFTAHLLMRPGMTPYLNRNYYIHNRTDVWEQKGEYRGCNLPVVLVSMQPSLNNDYSEAISLLSPMYAEEFAPWSATKVGKRGENYEALKKRYAQAMVETVSRVLSGLEPQIEDIYTSTPLTYRDYTCTVDGSAYGIVKDCRSALLSRIPVRMKIENLYFTGQNLNMHGCLGVCASAAVTCSVLLGEEYLVKKIGNA